MLLSFERRLLLIILEISVELDIYYFKAFNWIYNRIRHLLPGPPPENPTTLGTWR